MIFGQAPPPLEQDEAYAQPCFMTQCAIAKSGKAPEPCPKVRRRCVAWRGHMRACTGGKGWVLL